MNLIRITYNRVQLQSQSTIAAKSIYLGDYKIYEIFFVSIQPSKSNNNKEHNEELTISKQNPVLKNDS